MSSNTDFHAQLANGLSSETVSYEDYQRMDQRERDKLNAVVLNVDLANHSDSILVDSIGQICQGVIGKFISDNGGLEKMVRGKSEEINGLAFRQEFEKSRKFMVEQLIRELAPMIDEIITKRVQPQSSADLLLNRIRDFSLLDALPANASIEERIRRLERVALREPSGSGVSA